MRRRQFITLLGGAAAWPVVARAQQGERVRTIAVMISIPEEDPEAKTRVVALVQGLEPLGWVSGRNLLIEYRWNVSTADRARDVAKELVQLAPDVILVSTTSMAVAVRQQTRSIPIVFANISDPIGTGLVDSLSRPGGNITGFSNFEYGMGQKWLQLLKDLAPQVTRVGLVLNPTNPTSEIYLRSLEGPSPSFGVHTITVAARDAQDVQRNIQEFARQPNGGLIVLPDPLTTMHRALIIELSERLALPAIYPYRFFAVSGGLLAYGADIADMFRRSAFYIDRILKGAAPSELPVQQPTKFDFVINLKTARALGLEIPPTLLARADEVIE